MPPQGRRYHLRRLTTLGVVVVLAIARPAAVPVVDSDPSSDLQPSLSRTERQRLIELIARGNAERARSELTEHLSERPPDCTPYRLAVEAARQTGSLEELGSQLHARLQRYPDDLFIVTGYAMALEAMREYERSRNLLARAVRQRAPCARAYELFVRVSQVVGRLDEAENLLLSKAGARSGVSAWLSYGRGLVEEARGDNARALASYERALLRRATPKEAYYRGSLLLELAGELERALDWADAGVAVAEETGAGLLRLLGQESNLLYRLDRVEDSLPVLDRALELAAPEPQWVVSLLLRHAHLASIRGEHDRAAALVKRAESVELDGLRDALAADAMLGLGRSYLNASDLGRARESFAESLDRARASGDPFAIWDAQIGLVQVDLMEGFAHRALQAVTPLLERAIALEDAPRQTVAVETAATIYERLGSFDRALELYRLALKGSELQLDLSRRALTLANIAIVEIRLGRGAAALTHAEEATRLAPRVRDRRLETGLLQSLGAALAGAGRLDEARLVYEQALTPADPSHPELYGLLLSGLGRVLLTLGDIERARERFQSALSIPGGVSQLVRLQAISGLGLAAWRQGELTEALEWLESSLEVVESSRQAIATEGDRLRYLETRFTLYANLAGVLTELDERDPGKGYAEHAFRVIERSRARALLDTLDRNESRGTAARLASASIDLAEGLELFEPGELFFEYALGDEHSTLWVISRSDLHRYSLPSRQDIEREVVRYLKTIRTPPRAPSNPFEVHRRSAATLYRMLIEPAEELLDGARHVIVAPHGILHHLPLESLGERVGDDGFRYLVEDHVFSYVPSLSVLTGLRRRATSDATGLDFVGFAQSRPRVAVPGAVLMPIPFANEEITAASRAFSPGRFELVHGELATEARLKQELAAPHRIIHIAAHALADRSRPDRSAIFVGSDELGREDGILTMREVLALSVASDVVVLSGCETGLGRVMEIEGTLGFTWAFLSSGATTVAVTLWNVNDRASAEFVQSFYDRVGAGDSLAEALAGAKRDMLRSTRRAYRHPYFWAPMIVVGLDYSGASE